MTPREADPNGANSGGGAAGIESDLDVRREGPEGRPQDEAGNETSRIDTTERNVVTSGIAQTSEVADRDAQDDAEGGRRNAARALNPDRAAADRAGT